MVRKTILSDAKDLRSQSDIAADTNWKFSFLTKASNQRKKIFPDSSTSCALHLAALEIECFKNIKECN